MIKKFINNIKEKHKKDKEEYNKLTYFEKRILSEIKDFSFGICLCFCSYIVIMIDILCFLGLM